ncbi:hypothetical protein SLA2020_285280 [Shorea laevis]
MAGIGYERWGSRLIGMVVFAFLHVWPDMKFGWKIAVGTIIGFLGAAFGSVGGVEGWNFCSNAHPDYWFDQKSSTALSKCMITGGAAATVFYNLRQRHPTLELPIIDYDLALLFQPMLVLGIILEFSFNVIFADWMITILLIIIFIVMSTKAFLKGVETWKKETRIKKDSLLQTSPVSILKNIYWKELGILIAVWVIILAFQIAKNYTTACSAAYWALNLLQIPVAVGVTSYEAVNLYKGRRVIASKGEGDTIASASAGSLLCLRHCSWCGWWVAWSWRRIHSWSTVSRAGNPSSGCKCHGDICDDIFFIHVGCRILPSKTLPSSLCALLFCRGNRCCPCRTTVVTKVIAIVGRASLIIFVLAATIFVSAISLGGVGVVHMVEKIKHKQDMGFESLCTYHA